MKCQMVLASLLSLSLAHASLAEDKPGAEPLSAEANEAIKKITELGGAVRKVAQNDDSLEVDFHLGGKALTDDGLALVKKLPKVVEVHLKDTKITDAGLEHLADMKPLVRLHLELTRITDAALPHLAGLENLEYLNLYGTEVTDAGLDHLKGLTKLKKLYVWQTKVTDEGIKKLKESLPNVEVIK